MAKKPKDSQVVVRITKELERKIERLADKRGLTKAGWFREMAILQADRELEANAQ